MVEACDKPRTLDNERTVACRCIYVLMRETFRYCPSTTMMNQLVDDELVGVKTLCISQTTQTMTRVALMIGDSIRQQWRSRGRTRLSSTTHEKHFHVKSRKRFNK
jgi:hypothetical protein